MSLDLVGILKLTQEELLDFCEEQMVKRKYRDNAILHTEDYLYCKGNIPVLLVAHCDIVHKSVPQIIVNDKEQRILWSPTGIGGDDRCGVYAILKICEEFKPYVLFTTDEEVGGLGVKKFIKEIDDIPVNFIIEIDRRGNKQVVYYDCGNKEFQNYIESFGFNKQWGSYSDVSTLQTHYDIAGCNVSAGYYNEHTTSEHIYMEHLENTIEMVKDILRDKDNHKKYDCQEIKSYYSCNYDYYDCYNTYWDDWYYDETSDRYIRKKNKSKKIEIEEDLLDKEEDYYNLTKDEWKQKYKTNKPVRLIDLY